MQVRLRPFVLYNWKSPFATREVNVYCPHLRLFLTCLTFQIRRLHPSFLPSQNCVILRVEIKSGNYGWDTGEQIPVLSLPVCYYKYSNIIFNNMIIYIECFCANYRRKAIPFQSTTKGIFSIIYSLMWRTEVTLLSKSHVMIYELWDVRQQTNDLSQVSITVISG